MKGKRRAKVGKVALAVILTAANIMTSVNINMMPVQAAGSSLGKGSLADTVVGRYYWDTGSVTNVSLLSKLPTKENQGVHRFTTTSYDMNNGAIDTTNWGSSMMWSLNGGNAYGNTTYAIPWAYKASSSKQGMLITKPATTYVQSSQETADYIMNMPEDGSMSEFVVKPGYNTNGIKVDKVTDWTYETVMQNASNTAQYMKTTMVQGSPFAYFEMNGSTQMVIERMRNLPSDIVYYDGNTAENSTMLVVRV